jgi:outer membrane biosynthesis protein TonB
MKKMERNMTDSKAGLFTQSSLTRLLSGLALGVTAGCAPAASQVEAKEVPPQGPPAAESANGEAAVEETAAPAQDKEVEAEPVAEADGTDAEAEATPPAASAEKTPTEEVKPEASPKAPVQKTPAKKKASSGAAGACGAGTCG